MRAMNTAATLLMAVAMSAQSTGDVLTWKKGANLADTKTYTTPVNSSLFSLNSSGNFALLAQSNFANASHTHPASAITDFNSVGDARWALLSHTHTIANVTGLLDSLNRKQTRTDLLGTHDGRDMGAHLFPLYDIAIGHEACTGSQLLRYIENGYGLRDFSEDDKLRLRTTEELTLDRYLTFLVGDADRTLTLTGNASITGTNTGDQTLNGLLPTQTSNSGKYLTTNGTNASWATVASGSTWGSITGTLGSQTDLNTALNALAAPTATFSTNTNTAQDPGQDAFRFNNATIGSVTEISLSDVVGGVDKGDLNSRFSGIIQFRPVGTTGTIEFQINSVVHTSWTRYTVTYLKGTLPANGTVCAVRFLPSAPRNIKLNGTVQPTAVIEVRTGTTDTNGELIFDLSAYSSVTVIGGGCPDQPAFAPLVTNPTPATYVVAFYDIAGAPIEGASAYCSLLCIP
jgi:hypothetical protein